MEKFVSYRCNRGISNGTLPLTCKPLEHLDNLVEDPHPPCRQSRPQVGTGGLQLAQGHAGSKGQVSIGDLHSGQLTHLAEEDRYSFADFVKFNIHAAAYVDSIHLYGLDVDYIFLCLTSVDSI